MSSMFDAKQTISSWFGPDKTQEVLSDFLVR